MKFFSVNNLCKVIRLSASILSIVVLLSLKSASSVFAIIYQPGETLNPACSPTDIVCRVAAPAGSGTNSDITSLTGITTPIPVSEGGIGLSSIPTGGLIYGVGSNTFSALAIGTTSQVLTVSGSGLPVWTSISVINPGTTVSSTLRWNGSNWIESGALINNGTNVTVTNNLSIGGTFVSVGSTNLVSNLNANYLNGILSSGFVGIGQTGGFLAIGQTDSLPYVNDVTNTSLTRSGTGPYTIALNLGSSNTWTGLQTFGNIAIGGTFLSVGSTNLVSNLNSNYLNGISSSGFVGIGQTSNFLQTGYTGFDNYNHWTLQTNGAGSTNVLSSNIVNFVSGVGISLSQSGSTVTIANIGSGSTYAAGSGIALGSNTFSLDLGSSNIWTGLQTFGNISIGGTFLSVGSTNLVSNLNANYLNGVSGSSYVNIGQTGNYITTLNNGNGINITGSGSYRSVGVSSPTCAGTDKLQWNGSNFICSADIGSTYSAGSGLSLGSNTFSLDLGSINVWTALQTLTNGIGVSGSANLTNNLSVGGTFVSVGSTNLVTNLNANYLNGISSSGFVGIGQTGNFLTIGQTGGFVGIGQTSNFLTVGYTGFDNYNHWSLQTNGVGSTNVLSTNTVNFVNGIGISLSQSGSTITVHNIGAGSTYAAGSGLALGSNTFSLDLGSSNIWTGLQTFGNLSIGGTTIVTNATRLNYLSGISSTNGSLVIGVGSSLSNLNIGTSGQILMSNGSTPVWMTISGLGQTYSSGTGLTSPSTGIIALNLGSSNVWTGLQTFNGGVSANTIKTGSGDLSLNIGTTNSSDKFVIGNSGNTTPDLLVLDNGTTDPIGTNGAMYYNNTTNKFRCYENGSWRNCTGSNTTGVGATFGTVILQAGSTLLSTVTVTPTTAAGDIYIYADLFTNSLAGTDQIITAEIRSGTTCAGTLLAEGVASLTGGNGTNGPSVLAATLIQNPGATAQNYAICGKTSSAGDSSTRGIVSAIVIDTGADLAEIYTTNDNSLEPGDVVSFDSNLNSGMKKSQVAYDSTAFGIITTNPGIIIGNVENEGSKALPVALAGRVPVKVNIENGPIVAGDYLTSSSIPGVAMKAVKAGTIIGQAMTSHSDQSVGKVIAFIKNGSFNGVKTDQNLSSTDILSSLIQHNSQIVSATVNLSEINTDKAIADVEMITPKITTQDLFAANASISGTLIANTIKANNIDGLSQIIDQKINNQIGSIKIASGSMTVKDFEASGSAKFNGSVEFQGPVIFKTIAEFMDKTIFRNRVEFNDKDMGGIAIIKQSTSEIEVKFDKPYEQIPIVNISLVYEGVDMPTFIEEGEKAAIAYLNRDGFKIIHPNFAVRDFRYHWVAFAIKDAKTSVTEPTINPSPILTPIPTVTLIITPTVESSPSATPTPTPAI